MRTKSLIYSATVVAATLTASVALAASHGGSFGGGGSRGGAAARSSFGAGRTGTGFNRFGGTRGNFHNFGGNHFHHHHHFHDDDFFFFGFGDPFFYPFGYGYYPYGYYPYGYPYGYAPYGYGYPGGYGYGGAAYGSGYETSGSGVANIQRRLARAGYYHGRIDGVMGPRTRSAMHAYERDHGVATR
jgi:Putative peptidoglycan binding domain